MTTLAEYRQSIIDTSPWLYWSMEEGTGTTLGDDSGNTRDGTATLAAGGWEIARPFPSARSVSSLITSTGASQAAEWTGTLPIGGAGTIFSFMVWVRVISTAAGQVCFALESSAAAAAFEMRVTNLLCTYYQNGTTNNLHSLVSGAWTNIIGVRSATNYIGYVNGTAQTTWALSSNLTGHDRLRVRSTTGGSSEFAHLTFWNRALTAGEITTFNGAVSGPLPSTLVFAPQIPPISSLSRTRTAFALPPIFVSDRDSLAYTPQQRGSDVTHDFDIPVATMSTATVGVLNLASSDNLLDYSTASASAYLATTSITNLEWRNRIAATSPYVWYPLDEGTGTVAVDASGHGRNGTYQATSPGPEFLATAVTSSFGTNSLVAHTRGSWPGYDLVGAATPQKSASITDGVTYMIATYSVFSGTNNGKVEWYGSLGGAGAWSHTSGNGSIIGTTLVVYDANTIGRWNLYFWWVSKATLTLHAFFNGKLISGSGIAQTLSTQDSSMLTVSNYNNDLYKDRFQHIAFWDRLLTHAEMMDIVAPAVAPTFFLDITKVYMTSTNSLLDMDIPAATLDLSAAVQEAPIASTADLLDIDIVATGYLTTHLALESADDLLDQQFADTVPTWLMTSSDDLLDIEASATGMILTVFLDIASTPNNLLDFSTADALLRRSVFPASSTTSTITMSVAAAVGTLERSTPLLGFTPITLTVDTRSSITKRATLGIPRVPESVSDTDPSQATGLIVRALMGVSVDMDDPIIIDGKPT